MLADAFAKCLISLFQLFKLPHIYNFLRCLILLIKDVLEEQVLVASSPCLHCLVKRGQTRPIIVFLKRGQISHLLEAGASSVIRSWICGRLSDTT